AGQVPCRVGRIGIRLRWTSVFYLRLVRSRVLGARGGGYQGRASCLPVEPLDPSHSSALDHVVNLIKVGSQRLSYYQRQPQRQ
ncbi:MAG: hypothetical protein ACPGWR_20645, partial [Ardenticatenaceae bacterium]